MAFASPITGWMSRVFVTLTVLALAVRFALPGGIMLQQPAEDGDLPALVICSSAGLITIKAESYGIPAKPASGGHQDNGESGKSGEPCVFAAVAANVAPPAPALLELAAPVAAPAPSWAAVQQRPGEGLAAPPPPATGPPSLV
ncbi:DUF2946 family protein [Emcibacter sp. SYSU 3D8]|uniref:DUF2946 family protein n=1 Tax=Emcibacter sp. SYSU 3D8 TaxID=3133969 RepID=UPI0031FF219E